jgi:hypothetical protein
VNFKVKHTDKFWTYNRSYLMEIFFKYIKTDMKRFEYSKLINDEYLVVKDQTIKSKLIKTLFDM